MHPLRRKLCLAVDVQGYGPRAIVRRSAALGALEAVLDTAAGAAALDRSAWEHQPDGDAELYVLPDDQPDDRVVDAFARELATALYRHNQELPLGDRLRVRLAIDQGLVQRTDLGHVGGPVTAVGRMVDSAPGKHVLAQSADVDLVVLLSDQVHRDLVLGGHTSVTADRTHEVRVGDGDSERAAWLWVPGSDPDRVRRALIGLGGGLAAALPEIGRLQAVLAEGRTGDPDTAHTLAVFQRVVELVDASHPFTAHGTPTAVALAYVVAEATIVHGIGGGSAVAAVKRELDVLLGAIHDVDVADYDALRRLVGLVSVVEPGRIQGAVQLGAVPAARSFTRLWGLAQLALLLDNPVVMSAQPPGGVPARRAVVDVRAGAGEGVVLVDVAAEENVGFHLAAEANHNVREYFRALDDLWRRSHLIAPVPQVELGTPRWPRRTYRAHDIRVDPKPITQLLMGRALYGDRPHVWLRELVQNALDACRISAGSHGPRVEVEREDHLHVVVRDNGVGMTLHQVTGQLSVLGRSGWRESAPGDAEDRPAFFGRFGIGFAAVFGVASSVTVLTRTADMPPDEGVRVEFSTPDRPFYTDVTTCAVGTEIRVTLARPLTRGAFSSALADLFAYLPPHVWVSPDPCLPHSLAEVSEVRDAQWFSPSWEVYQRSGTAALGSCQVEYKLEIPYNPDPRERNGIVGNTAVAPIALTACVSGVVVSRHQWLTRKSGPTVAPWLGPNTGWSLRGWNLTVDFTRDEAPVVASRNALALTGEQHRDVIRLLHRVAATAIPALLEAVLASCGSDRERRQAVHDTLWQLVDDPARRNAGTSTQVTGPIATIVATAFRRHCPVLVVDGQRFRHQPLDAVGAGQRCLVVLREVVGTPAFSAFARTTDFDLVVVAENHFELSLLLQAWPHRTRPEVVQRRTGLNRYIQRAVSEVHDSPVRPLLRGDHALSTGAVFGGRLFVRLADEAKQAERGFLLRRDQVAPGRPPRVLLNRDHEVVAAMEAHLAAGGAADVVRDWLDLFCAEVVEVRSQDVVDQVLPRLLERLTAITGVPLDHLGAADVREWSRYNL